MNSFATHFFALLLIGLSWLVCILAMVAIASSALFAPPGYHLFGTFVALVFTSIFIRRYTPLMRFTGTPFPREWTGRCSWLALLAISYFWLGSCPREAYSAEMALSLAIGSVVLLIPFIVITELVLHFQDKLFLN